MSQSRQTHLDSLRGIAALIVVIVHYLEAFYPYTVFGSQGEYHQHSGWENIFFFPPFGLISSGNFAVCLFFILSGYVLSYSQLGEPLRVEKILVLIVKRPIRLGGLVCFSIIIGSLLWYYGLFFNGEASHLTSSRPFFSNFWVGKFDSYTFFVNLATSAFSKGNLYNPPLWTIKIELYGSMMVYLFILLFGRFKFRIFVSILLIFLFKNSLYQGFWIGLSLADIMKNHTFRGLIKSQNTYYYLLLTLFIYFSSYPNYVNQEFLEGTIYRFLPDDKGFGGGYSMFSALLIFILTLSNTRLQEHLNLPALQFLGGISYGLYVMHLLVIGSLSSWMFLMLYDLLDYNLAFSIVFFSGLPVIILMAYLATRYIDTPAIKLAGYIGSKTIGLTALSPVRKLFLHAEKLITRVP